MGKIGKVKIIGASNRVWLVSASTLYLNIAEADIQSIWEKIRHFMTVWLAKSIKTACTVRW